MKERAVLRHGLRYRQAPRRTAIAVAQVMVVAIYHRFRETSEYTDPGVDGVATRERATEEARPVKRLHRLGYDIAVQPRAS